MQDAALHLLAGLGNPGREYDRTRHNIGFAVMDYLAERYAISLTGKKPDCIFGRGAIEQIPVLLAKPQAFMNRSGPPLRRLADYFRIPSQEMLVLHDDIDLAFERIKIKEKGGDGGHKGVRSIIEAFGTGEFVRVRIGVGRGAGRPGDQRDMTGHVLGRFSGAEGRQLDRIIEQAAEAVVAVLRHGTTVGMNRFNKKIN
jgi:PTH1 family peptidyl-tRNA hydrolase